MNEYQIIIFNNILMFILFDLYFIKDNIYYRYLIAHAHFFNIIIQII